MKKFFADRPWIWLVAGYLILTGGAVACLVIAIRHAPEPVPLEQTR